MKHKLQALALLSFATLAIAQKPALSPPNSPEQTLLSSLANQLAPCLNAVGLQGRFPVAPEGLPKPTVAYAEVPSIAHASDGLHYSLSIQGEGKSLFILQYGGIRGDQVRYGPIDLSDSRLTCHSARQAEPTR